MMRTAQANAGRKAAQLRREQLVKPEKVIDLTGLPSDDDEPVAKKRQFIDVAPVVPVPLQGLINGLDEKEMWVTGTPQSYQQRKFSVRAGRYFNPNEKAMKQFSKECVKLCAPPESPWDTAIEMEIRYRFNIPASIKRMGQRASMIGTPCIKKIDLDNLTKFVFDALSGVYYEDDKLIYKLTVIKEWTDCHACTIISLREK